MIGLASDWPGFRWRCLLNSVRKKWLGALSPPTFQEMRYPKKFSSKEQKRHDRDDRPIDDAYCEKHRRIISAHEKPRRQSSVRLAVGEAKNAAARGTPINHLSAGSALDLTA